MQMPGTRTDRGAAAATGKAAGTEAEAGDSERREHPQHVSDEPPKVPDPCQ